MPDQIPPDVAVAAVKEVVKEAAKEASKEWLDEKWAAFGQWTAKGLAASLFAALVGWALHGIIKN